jgi:hypothetical protein
MDTSLVLLGRKKGLGMEYDLWWVSSMIDGVGRGRGVTAVAFAAAPSHLGLGGVCALSLYIYRGPSSFISKMTQVPLSPAASSARQAAHLYLYDTSYQGTGQRSARRGSYGPGPASWELRAQCEVFRLWAASCACLYSSMLYSRTQHCRYVVLDSSATGERLCGLAEFIHYPRTAWCWGSHTAPRPTSSGDPR